MVIEMEDTTIPTTFSMAKETLTLVRQVRLIALTVSVLIAMGSICALMIFWH